MEPHAIADRDRAHDGPSGESVHKALRVTAYLYFAGYAIHSVDHLARGIDKTPSAVRLAGLAAFAASIVVVALVVRRHRSAASLAIVAGFGTALGVAAVHVPPEWGAFSQPFRDNVTALDWASVAVNVITALAFGIAGVYAWMHERSVKAEPLAAARG
jgi:hypothetical protein